mmetsp:Transcript_63715/g.113045  ORF Transcript_63715/g.113045 Transcript_63715/m.113045 type:complete len:145 (+) Transcript_63715:77-511(+)
MSKNSWSYAPTNRATCKGACKQKIEKGAIRLGTELDIGGNTSMVYRNLKCVTIKQIQNMKEKEGGLDKLEGFAELTEEDQAKVLAQEDYAKQAAEDAAAEKEKEKAAKAEAKKKAKEEAKAAKASEKAAAKAAAGGSPAKKART